MPELYRLEHLVALESSGGALTHRLIVGHNVAYDRSRVREQYYRKVRLVISNLLSIAHEGGFLRYILRAVFSFCFPDYENSILGYDVNGNSCIWYG